MSNFGEGRVWIFGNDFFGIGEGETHGIELEGSFVEGFAVWLINFTNDDFGGGAVFGGSNPGDEVSGEGDGDELLTLGGSDGSG